MAETTVRAKDLPMQTPPSNVFDVGGYLKTLVDESGAPATTYVGTAQPGAATSAASWNIQKIAVAASVTTITYANGRPDVYNQVWDDRASLTYA